MIFKEEIEKNMVIKEKKLSPITTLNRREEFLAHLSINMILIEPVVIKIFFGKHDNRVEKLYSFNQLKNEIIYTYKGRNETKYAVEFYQNEEGAKKSLEI